jgi:hypothetical protein
MSSRLRSRSRTGRRRRDRDTRTASTRCGGCVGRRPGPRSTARRVGGRGGRDARSAARDPRASGRPPSSWSQRPLVRRGARRRSTDSELGCSRRAGSASSAVARGRTRARARTRRRPERPEREGVPRRPTNRAACRTPSVERCGAAGRRPASRSCGPGNRQLRSRQARSEEAPRALRASRGRTLGRASGPAPGFEQVAPRGGKSGLENPRGRVMTRCSAPKAHS